MFCVSDTHNKMKKCPKVIGEMHGINKEWGVCACALASLMFPGLFSFADFLCLMIDVYLTFMLNQKMTQSIHCFFVVKLCQECLDMCLSCLTQLSLQRRGVHGGLDSTLMRRHFACWREQNGCFRPGVAGRHLLKDGAANEDFVIPSTYSVVSFFVDCGGNWVLDFFV